MTRLLLPFTFVLLLCKMASASMRFASPLQVLTIWDTNDEPMSPREKYLQKYKAGLEAEKKVREELKKKHDAFLSKQDTASPEWAEKAVRYERVRKSREERLVEKAYDEAVKRVEAEQKGKESGPVAVKKNTYQFVGVVNSKDENKPVTWYARTKPEKANWSLRLVHVNRDAIIKDLFDRGKVDIFSKYKNDGFKTAAGSDQGPSTHEQRSLLVKAQYEVRERSWRLVKVNCDTNFGYSSTQSASCSPERYGTSLRSIFSPIHPECTGVKGAFHKVFLLMAQQCSRRHIATRMAAMAFAKSEL